MAEGTEPGLGDGKMNPVNPVSWLTLADFWIAELIGIVDLRCVEGSRRVISS